MIGPSDGLAYNVCFAKLCEIRMWLTGCGQMPGS